MSENHKLFTGFKAGFVAMLALWLVIDRLTAKPGYACINLPIGASVQNIDPHIYDGFTDPGIIK